MKRLDLTEKQIENTILSWLFIQGIFAHKVDNVGIFDQKIGRYRMKQSVHRKLGISDILCCYKGRFVAIEVKRKGGKLSEHQERYLKDVNASGGLGFVARSIEDCAREMNIKDLKKVE